MRSHGEWIDVPADPYVFVVNLGDMLDRMTRGRYRSDPHRVRNLSGQDRVSFPLFLDPSWDARVTPLPDSVFAGEAPPEDDAVTRWDGASVHEWDGAYGDYLTAKVARVFPDLMAASPATDHRVGDRSPGLAVRRPVTADQADRPGGRGLRRTTLVEPVSSCRGCRTWSAGPVR